VILKTSAAGVKVTPIPPASSPLRSWTAIYAIGPASKNARYPNLNINPFSPTLFD